MKNKIITIGVCVCMILSLLFIYNVQGDSVSSVTTTPGTVNCIVSFTCSDSSDSIIIYYNTSSGIDTGDMATYTDPDDCTYSARTNRKMLITGLTEETTYYYRIYADGEGWASSEDSFKTLPRFTTDYVDLFYDEYLVDSSSNMDVEQQTGVKHGSAIIDESGSGVYGVGYPSVVMDGDTLWISVHDYVDRDYLQLYKSTNNGTSFTDEGRWTMTGEPGPPDNDRRFGGWTNDSENNQYVFTYVIDEKDGYLATSNTLTGTYSTTKVLESDDNPNSQCFILNSNLDIYGANKWIDLGKFRLASGDTWRYVGYSWGFNDTDWFSDNVRRDNNGGTGTNDYQVIGGEQCYWNDIMCHGGGYVDFNHPYDEGGDELIDVYLMFSRDGIDFDAVDSSSPIIPLGSGGSFDDGMLFASSQQYFYRHGDYDYIYYAAWNGNHASGSRECTVSRIRFRHDGLTAYEPSSSSAYFVTTEIKRNFTANFTVNGDFDATNNCSIAVLYSGNNTVISGFDFNDFTPLTSDSLTHTPTWGSNNLSDIPNTNFKLNFSFSGSSGKLFGIYMDNESYSPSPQPQEDIQFTSISNQTNGSTVYNSYRTFVWTNYSNTQYYHLQVSNSSNFATTFINLTYINATTYPSHYSDNSTHITFVLPESHKVNWTGTHYYRVRAWYD